MPFSNLGTLFPLLATSDESNFSFKTWLIFFELLLEIGILSEYTVILPSRRFTLWPFTVFGFPSIASFTVNPWLLTYFILLDKTVTFPSTGDIPLTVRTPPLTSAGSILDGNLPFSPTLGILLASLPTWEISTLSVNELRLIPFPKATTLPI